MNELPVKQIAECLALCERLEKQLDKESETAKRGLRGRLYTEYCDIMSGEREQLRRLKRLLRTL